MNKITTSPHMPTEIEIESISDINAKISAFPFESGYAVTLAHPLRRLLYSSTVGYAPTGIKIEGVSHEFDSMRGMLEDVALFIINLKNIRLKIKSEAKLETINYSFKGPKELYGADLINDLIDVVNKEEYLGTINEDAELVFSIIVQKGIGYVPSEKIREILDEDFIALDAFFTPVKQVVYDIENVLVEDNPDFEKIVFDITTDGQVTPIEAFKNSLEAMYSQMSVFRGILDAPIEYKEIKEKPEIDMNKLLQNIEELNLSARSFNCLDRTEMRFVGELVLMSEAELKSLKNLGKKSLEEIKSVMKELGFPFDSEIPQEMTEELRKKISELKSQKKEVKK